MRKLGTAALIALLLTGEAVSQPQGGRLAFSGPLGKQQDTSLPERRISLVEYAGKPLKGLQLRIIVSGPVRVASVRAGSALAKAGEWNLHSVIARSAPAPGAPYQDTVKAVFYGNGPAALAGGAPAHLLTLAFDTTDARRSAGPTVRLSLRGVLGALDNGDNAGVVPDADDAFDVNLP
jgi:hypothetical protein